MSEGPPAGGGKLGFLKKKYLGISGMYYAAVVVAVLVYAAWKIKPATTDAVAGDTTDTSGDQALAGDAASAGSGYSAFSANPAPGYNVGGDTGAVDPGTTVDTNEAWLRRGVEWGAVNGLGTADTIVIALQAYLNGDQLSIAQGSIRDKVIAHFGLPPELPSSGGTAATPPGTTTGGGTTPTPSKRQITPPGYHTVKGSTDNDYPKLATLYYPGTEVHQSLDLIQVANTKLPRSGTIPVGTRVFIPKYHAPVYAVAKFKLQTLHEFAVKANRSSGVIQELNDGMKFPVKVGTHVRIA